MSTRCAGNTKRGTPCKGYAITGSRFCVAHDPMIAAERAAWRKAGGRARAVGEGTPVELLNVNDVRVGLAAVIGSTWELQNSPERNRVLIAGYKEALATFQVGELEERLVALENLMNEITIEGGLL